MMKRRRLIGLALALLIGGSVAYVYWPPRREPGMVAWTQRGPAAPPLSLPPTVRGPLPGMPGLPQTRGTPGVPGIPGMPMPTGRTSGVVDLNTASPSQLKTLPGMTDDYARKILAGRPFHSRADLEHAGIPKDVFDRMSPPAMISWAVVDVDLNTAPLAQLQTLPGMTDDYARKILAGRPFHSRAELERAGIPGDVFDAMSPPAMLKFAHREPPSTLP